MSKLVNFKIPATASLALGTLTACGGDTVVGDWDVSQRTYDGEVYEFPVEYTYDYYGDTWTYSLRMALVVQDDLTGVFSTHYTQSINDVVIYDYSYDYAVQVTKESKSEYTIAVEDDPMELNCTVEGDVMTCLYDGDANNTMTFER